MQKSLKGKQKQSKQIFYKLLKQGFQQGQIKNMSDKIIKKNQFQIRKVPVKRFPPQKLPELYALDIHSICLPKKDKKNINWASINCDLQKNFDEQFNDRIMYSQTYQLLYSKYSLMKQERQREKQSIQSEIDASNSKIQNQQKEKSRLTNIRDNFYSEIQNHREELTDCRNKNYNLRWEIYHQRGTYYVNANNFSFLGNADATYEDYLLLEEQMGNVSRGLNEIELALLPKSQYAPQVSLQNQDGLKQCSNPENQKNNFTKEICCICYDEINKGEYITILKCRHMHHCECIKDWLIKQKNCPICKKQVILDQFHLRKQRQGED